MNKPNNTKNAIDTKYWSLIPSDPDVFDDMIKEYGVKNTKAEQLLSVELENLQDDGPVYGLVFISEYSEESLEEGYDIADPDEEDVIFTSQIVTNACGTLAIIGVLLNAEIEDKGEILTNFQEFTKGFSPINRGICLGNSDEIRRIHNAYTPAHQKVDNLLVDTNATSSNNNDQTYTEDYEKVYHYVTYIYKNGFLWEMDGLNYRPKKICKCEKKEWLEKTQPLVQKRMNDSNIKTDNAYDFSLIVIKHDSFPKLAAESELLKSNLKKFDKIVKNVYSMKESTIQKHCKQFSNETDINAANYSTLKNIWSQIETLSDKKVEEVQANIESIRNEHSKLETAVKVHEESRKSSSDNACRQKFDYFPFIELITQKAVKRGLLDEPEQRQPPKKKLKKILITSKCSRATKSRAK